MISKFTALAGTVLALGLTGCDKLEDPDGVPIEAPRKLVGGACVGTAKLDKGARLYAQKLDIDDDLSTTALVALVPPGPRYKYWFLPVPKSDGLINVRFRDTANIPAFAPGARTYEDNLRDGLRNGEGKRTTERGNGVELEGFSGGNEQYFIAKDAAQTLLTCDTAGGDRGPYCDVDTRMDGGRYRLITTFAYAKRLQFQDVVTQAEAEVRKAFVPCP